MTKNEEIKGKMRKKDQKSKDTDVHVAQVKSTKIVVVNKHKSPRNKEKLGFFNVQKVEEKCL